MSYLYPAALQKPVPYVTKGMAGSLGLVLHVQQGENSLASYFANPNNKAMSHFWVSKTGVVEQYKDCAFQSWAQEAGNPTYHSVETEGYETTSLTEAQVEAVAALYVWGQQTFGWPLKLANVPGDAGLIYHAAGGAAWGNHPCPGPLRIAQRADILAAITPIPGDDMTPAEMLAALDGAAKSTEAGIPVAGTEFIEAIARRTVAILKASKVEEADAATVDASTPKP